MGRPADLAVPAAPGRALLRACAVAVLLAGTGLLLRHSGVADLRGIRPTVSGALVLVAGGAVLSATGLPRQLVAFAGGYVFGAWAGAALSLLAQIMACGLDYAAAHGALAAWARRWVGRSAGLGALHRRLIAHPFSATLMLRLLPVGSNVMVNLLAGVAGVRPVPFLTATLIGYVPQTVIFSLLGSGVQIGRGAQLAASGVLFVMAAGLGLVLWRRSKEKEGVLF